ncbi:hypothetical protein PTTG_09442 [Puccinia triticina 1-1 BBBD Race 1]|uniref:Succinate dehydrogenase assembly factor 2, mitochondrial n=1 Tax=Puccinia triticina (isolate 1-1 / race 1 (BBBD)) TaxID=630390 RepID=A0A180G5W1_PUCT1|nr:hypothetical protein PTTG_09442 [Puccinia triticina 1-1 BBBD Race 1]WAR61248.1 hypothetical protein PtB15_13B501 [Puccinia triticina]
MHRIQIVKRVDRLFSQRLPPTCVAIHHQAGSCRMKSGTSSTDQDEKLHPIFSKTKPAPIPSFKTDPYPIPLQNPAHPTTQKEAKTSVNQEIYHQIDQLKQLEDQHAESYNDSLSASTIDKLRARLVYQSRKRGIVEIELLLSTFIETQRWLKDWDLKQLTQYSRLLMLPDWDLYYYLVKKQDPPSESEFFKSDLLDQLRIHTSNSNKTVRIMPSLES